ncbi:MAG: hypothetical protein U0T02_07065 [Solirubrobacteraceae bacterium]
MDGPSALLLLPRRLERFILSDLARDLLSAPRVAALEPGRLPYGAYGRMPPALAASVARGSARRLALRGEPRVLVMFHPLQWPLASALLERHPRAELWYSLWDRYDHALDASPRMRERLATFHAEAAGRAAWVFAASDALADLERAEGRAADVVPPPHDGFPAPDPSNAIVAVSLGHLGRRVDWGLLRAVAERIPELALLLVGEAHPDECRDNPDFAACRALPNLVWLGRLDDEAAARVILCADVGIVPFRTGDPFNDTALPQRIIKYARLGRRTLAPPLSGVLTWERAVTRCDGVGEWVAALRAAAGARTAPDLELREWALAQTGPRQDAPIWRRLLAAGVVDLADVPEGAREADALR